MRRRCQAPRCGRLFTGDICPACGFDHVIRVTMTAEECRGLPSWNGRAGGPIQAGTMRSRTCACGQAIPPGKGARKWCFDCRPRQSKARSDRYLGQMTADERRAMWRRARTKRRSA